MQDPGNLSFLSIIKLIFPRNLSYPEKFLVAHFHSRITLFYKRFPGNSEPWHFGNLVIFRTQTYLKPDIHSEPSQILKMECFVKIVESCNYFFKSLYFRSLAGFWIRPSLNKYSFTRRVISRCVFYKAYSKLCLLSWIQTYSGILTPYLDIFSHVLAYLEPCVTLAYIQNPAIFRILAYLEPQIYSELCQSIFWYI